MEFGNWNLTLASINFEIPIRELNRLCQDLYAAVYGDRLWSGTKRSEVASTSMVKIPNPLFSHRGTETQRFFHHEETKVTKGNQICFFLRVLLGQRQTLLKMGSFSDSFPKTFAYFHSFATLCLCEIIFLRILTLHQNQECSTGILPVSGFPV